ncbi:MAG TPA: hypothetical protein VFJ99_06060 [Solirubrobacterales bacterium]|nr:hypothetical protein [Solirubrobacterales bacterium]
MSFAPRTVLACGTAALLAIALLAALAPAAGASPTGHWKLTFSMELTTQGTVTEGECFPDPEQAKPTPLSATVTSHVVVRTTRPALVEAHEAPNGVPVFQESTFARGARAKVVETRTSGLDGGGQPLGCFGPEPAQNPNCGRQATTSGLYLSPLGGIHSWRGFTVELQQSTASRFGRCPVSGAQGKLPYFDALEIAAKPRNLTGHAPKLIFRRSQSFSASEHDHSTRSQATEKLTYTVKLARVGH